MEHSALQEKFSDCIHIFAVKRVANEIDAIHDIHPELDVSGMKIYVVYNYNSSPSILFLKTTLIQDLTLILHGK